jgi:hypothetical protein
MRRCLAGVPLRLIERAVEGHDIRFAVDAVLPLSDGEEPARRTIGTAFALRTGFSLHTCLAALARKTALAGRTCRTALALMPRRAIGASFTLRTSLAI